MRITEIFYSIQGEGPFMGLPCTFVRFSGCNLRCSWCDTPQSSWNPVGLTMTMGQILESVQMHPGCAVVITGGEPFLFPELPALCLALRQAGHAVHLETSGTLFQHIEADVLCISPKLSSSTPELAQYPEWHRQHEQSRLRPLVLRQFLETYGASVWFKFVVSSTEDLAEINTLMLDLSDLLPPDHVMLMPEGRTSAELSERALQVVDWCLQRGFRYSDRLHIRIWGNAPGK